MEFSVLLTEVVASLRALAHAFDKVLQLFDLVPG